MKKTILGLCFALFSGGAMAKTVAECIDGRRSMTVTAAGGRMTGHLNDFGLQLDNMTCGWIPGTRTLRCEEHDYYVVIFEDASGKLLTTQVNLKGDFYPDSGYLYSLSCQ